MAWEFVRGTLHRRLVLRASPIYIIVGWFYKKPLLALHERLHAGSRRKPEIRASAEGRCEVLVVPSPTSFDLHAVLRAIP